MHDSLTIKGTINYVLRDQFNNIKQSGTCPNLIVDGGKYLIASRMIGSPSALTYFIGLGTSSTAAASNQTALLGQLLRKQATVTQGSGAAQNQLTFSVPFNPGEATGSINEAGIFTAASDGTMINRSVIPVITKESGDTLTITWTIAFN